VTPHDKSAERPRPTGIAAPFLFSAVPLAGMAILHHALPVFAPKLMEAAGMPPQAFGWVGGALGLGSVWLYIANTAFTVALGPVRAWQIAVLIAIAGSALILIGLYPAILMGAMCLGFAYATATPAGAQILADHTPRAYRGSLFSLRQAGVPLGGVIAGAVGSWLIVAYGWRVAFAIMTACAVGLCSVLLFAPSEYNDSRPRHPFRLVRLFHVSNVLNPFRVLAAAPGLRRISAACVGFAAVQGATTAFFVTFMTAGLGFSLTFAGTLYAALLASSVAGRIVLGFVADWAGSPRPVLKALAVLSVISSLMIAAMSSDWSTPLAFGVVLFVGFSIATWNGLYLAEIAILAPDTVSEATAATTFFVFSTYMVTPPIAGMIISLFGYRAVFLVTACLAVTSAAILFAGGRDARA
jgi:MFS family permease